MKKLNKIKTLALCMAFCMLVLQASEGMVVAATGDAGNQAAPYTVGSYSWTINPGYTSLSGKIYLEAGDYIRLAVYPTNSSAPYEIGILQPSGTVRSTDRMGDSVTTYYINVSGYYRIRLHNSSTKTVTFRFDASY